MPDEVTKQSYRLKVWRHLENNSLAMFPRPVYNRIPNFKGAQEAAVKLSELEVFKDATTVKVNPDKPQEPVRLVCCLIFCFSAVGILFFIFFICVLLPK